MVAPGPRHGYFGDVSYRIRRLAGRSWRSDLGWGLKELGRHRNARALARFHRAASRCPVDESRELDRILYYMGMALTRLNDTRAALSSWETALDLPRNGLCRHILNARTNRYGMRRCETRDRDDLQAFAAVQWSRYLASRPTGRVSCLAERDVVADVINDAWVEIKRRGDLDGLTEERKLDAYRKVLIIFPDYVAEGDDRPVVNVDFRTGKRPGLDDRCSCGSGRPYRLCCGRTRYPDRGLDGS